MYSRHNNTYHTPPTCDLSLVTWYNTKTSKKGNMSNTTWPKTQALQSAAVNSGKLCADYLTDHISVLLD